jgi:N-acetylated-alpha-linked acidic dipeptidase
MKILTAVVGLLALAAAPVPEADQKWERDYRALPDAARIRENNRHLSAEPHHVGSPADAENARWMEQKFREWGLDAKIETFDVLFPTPRERALELIEPTRFKAGLAEPPVAGDPTSSQADRQLPTYNAYSIDGDVTAPLVYVNYGVPADYELLERMGVDVRGKIAIARYGASWRGIKPKVAAEHGAVACLIYSDPKDDGFFEGDVYPKGAYRPAAGVQRGSVADMPLYPGDPLTPGVGATKDAKRLDRKDAATLTKIPVMPISYGDAQPLLAALEGRVAPREWRGALPITYHVGPGPAKVHFKVAFNWTMATLHDVIVRIPGSIWPEEWVIHGNHHDGWVNGSSDPTSGMAALLEEGRAFGELLKRGWRPKRTIILCAWDGEEPGLLGSTEWVETHAAELQKKAVTYINTDSNGRGYLGIEGSHSLEALANEISLDIEDPVQKISAGKRARLKSIADAKTPEERREARERANLRISALGSGSDFTPFLQHLGVASLNMGFGGEGGGGVYHSIYDDFAWFTRFGDTDFAYGRALSQATGTTLMRLASADVLPFEFDGLADTVNKYVQEIQDLAKEKREATAERNREIEEGLFVATADERHPLLPPRAEPPVPYFDFSPLENASASLTAAAKEYASAFGKSRLSARPPDTAHLSEVNRLLRSVEQAFLREEGLPRRPWFKHYLYAPGFYTGYSVKTLPAVREALEEKQWKDVGAGVTATAQAIEKGTARIREAAKALGN